MQEALNRAPEEELSALAGSLLRSDARSTTLEGPQAFSLEQAQHELKAGKAASDQRIKEQAARHELEQRAKDNDLRRLAFKVVLLVLIAVLAVSFVVAVEATNDTTKAWAQGIVSTIMGAIGGGVVGYFTGKSSR